MMINNRRGSILVFTLWTLTILTVFAIQIGLTIGARANLLSRVENNSRLRYLTQSGVKKAIAALRSDFEHGEGQETSYRKYYRHNNKKLFSNIVLGEGVYNTGYSYCDWDCKATPFRFGVADEEGKLNINFASRDELTRLIEKTTSANSDEINTIVDGILGWRTHGDKELSGFYSDDRYASLPDPYEPKHAEFEILEELLLVRGVTEEFYRDMSSFITVYGDGLVNINSAPAAVLYALGLDEGTVSKVLIARRGIDKIEATDDDHTFLKSFDVVSDVKGLISLEVGQAEQIDQLNIHKKIKTSSGIYRIYVKANLSDRNGELYAKCIYNVYDNLVESYRENNTILY